TLRGQAQHDLAPDPAARTENDGNAPAEGLLRRHPLEFGLLERPVLDAERLGTRKRDVVVQTREVGSLLLAPRLRQGTGWRLVALEGGGATHDVDRVDEELRRDAR